MKNFYFFLSVILFATVFTSCSSDDEVGVPSKSSLNSISDFKINFEGIDNDKAVQYESTATSISISVPYGTSLKGLSPIVSVPNGATITPASGSKLDFEDGVVKEFVVTAEDGSVKTYLVTINVRGELGSGTKLKAVKYEIPEFGISETYSYTYNEYDLVSSYKKNEGSKDIEYTLIYNDKNQVIELKSPTENTSIVYTYENDLIVSAIENKDGAINYTYEYTYDTDGYVIKIVRDDKTATSNNIYIQELEYSNGNTVKHKKANDEYLATFDGKNNPFIGIYPKAYGKIQSGNEVLSVNVNNPITRTGADNGINYEYNTDDYPVNASYTSYGGYATNKYTFEYY